MSGITNKDIEFLGKKGLKIKNFLGVYPSDVLPNIKKKNMFACVFNLSEHDQEGTHFVSVVKLKKKIFYFDSFGKVCDNDNINKFMNSLKLKIFSNLMKIQEDSSHYCGLFAIYSVYVLLTRRKSMSSLQAEFEEDQKINDNKVLKKLTFILKKK